MNLKTPITGTGTNWEAPKFPEIGKHYEIKVDDDTTVTLVKEIEKDEWVEPFIMGMGVATILALGVHKLMVNYYLIPKLMEVLK